MGIAHDDNTSDRQTQESELAKMWFQNLVKAGAAPHGGGCGGNEKDMAEHVYDAMGGGDAQPQGEVVADDDAVLQEPLQMLQMGDEEDALSDEDEAGTDVGRIGSEGGSGAAQGVNNQDSMEEAAAAEEMSEQRELQPAQFGLNTPQKRKRSSLGQNRGVWLLIKRILDNDAKGMYQDTNGNLAYKFTHVCIKCWRRLHLTYDKTKGRERWLTTVAVNHNKKYHAEDSQASKKAVQRANQVELHTLKMMTAAGDCFHVQNTCVCACSFVYACARSSLV